VSIATTFIAAPADSPDCGKGIENGGVPSDGCNTPCKGNLAEYCGGSGRLNVYEADTPAANPTPPPVETPPQAPVETAVETPAETPVGTLSPVETPVEEVPPPPVSRSCLDYPYFVY
jgi:hypothetical protein